MTARGGLRLSGPRSGEVTEGSGSALVVDDDDGVRRTTGRVLTALGYDVVEAESGREALRFLEAKLFDVVVSDISMPEMDGIRLLREIRARDPHVQVILMTGVPTFETAVSALDYGACKYLEKPLEIDRLEQAVGRAVSLSRLARMENRAAVLSGHVRGQEADLVGLDVTFERALVSAFVVYQPILDAACGRVMGFEA
ncbi:MAG TPA: response regulator, partial [Polyangiaceae bacterium]